MSQRRSAIELRGRRLVGLRGLAPRLLLHPKQAGRCLPLSPLWSEMSPGRVPGAELVLGPVRSLVTADRAGDRRLERLAPHPVMFIEETEGSGDPPKTRPVNSPGRLHMGHRPIVPRMLGGTAGSCTQSEWVTATHAELLHFGPEFWSARVVTLHCRPVINRML